MQSHHVRAQHAAQRVSGPCSSSSRIKLAAKTKVIQQQRAVVVKNNWKVFGPTAEYSDGDAEFFRLTSQLSDQYEWFAPRQPDEEASTVPEPEDPQQQQQRIRRPEFGLSPREIAALGLSGPQHNMPDSVRMPNGRI